MDKYFTISTLIEVPFVMLFFFFFGRKTRILCKENIFCGFCEVAAFSKKGHPAAYLICTSIARGNFPVQTAEFMLM